MESPLLAQRMHSAFLPGRLGKSVGNTEEGHMWSCSLSPSFLRLRLLSGEPPTVI